jgi:phosphoglycerate dehydrogenase-like enzyme
MLGGVELRGKTIGIIGYGSIGREIGRMARNGFGMRVLAMRRAGSAPRARYVEPGVGDPQGHVPEGWYTPDELHSMLRSCDVVVLAMPLTEQTRGMIGEEELRAMKPGALLVNIARGELVDEHALVQALKENALGGAGLDAFAVEPLPRGSQLWHLENVIVSPHIAGATAMYDERAVNLFTENLRRFLTGMPLVNLVSREHGY